MAWTESERAYKKMCLKNEHFAGVNFNALSQTERENAEKRLNSILEEHEKQEEEFAKMRDGAAAKFQDRATEFYTGF